MYLSRWCDRFVVNVCVGCNVFRFASSRYAISDEVQERPQRNQYSGLSIGGFPITQKTPFCSLREMWDPTQRGFPNPCSSSKTWDLLVFRRYLSYETCGMTVLVRSYVTGALVSRTEYFVVTYSYLCDILWHQQLSYDSGKHNPVVVIIASQQARQLVD